MSDKKRLVFLHVDVDDNDSMPNLELRPNLSIDTPPEPTNSREKYEVFESRYNIDEYSFDLISPANSAVSDEKKNIDNIYMATIMEKIEYLEKENKMLKKLVDELELQLEMANREIEKYNWRERQNNDCNSDTECLMCGS